MEMYDELWSAAYGANDAIWESNESNVSVKMAAWRKQKLLLQHATRQLDEAAYYAVLKEHHDKMENSETTKQYFQQRLGICNQLLAQSRRRFSENKSNSALPLSWGIPDSNLFEHPCRGNYESCQHNEVTERELQLLQQLQQEEQEQQAPASNVHNVPTNSCNIKSKQPTTKQFVTSSNLVKSVAAPATAVAKASELAEPATPSDFCTAREYLAMQDQQKTGAASKRNANVEIQPKPKTLGTRRTVNSSYKLPIKQAMEASLENAAATTSSSDTTESITNPALASLDPELVKQILGDIMHKYPPVAWDDIAGLEYAKSIITESIIYPLKRPDIFKGLRRPPRGILLFGPPGTGKTLIAKCVASQSGATFFSINPSTLTSKWVGEGEKLVKTMFCVAAAHQPAVIFIDEVDSLLSQRSENEHESSRRLKNEFFIQLDGATTNEDEQIIIIGATNRPQELDEAVRRRFVRRLYVPLPELEARKQIIEKLIATVTNNLSNADVVEIAKLTEGYSGADLKSLCHDASMEPVRDANTSMMGILNAGDLRDVHVTDFHVAMQHVGRSVSTQDAQQYVAWNKDYGAKR